MTRRTKIVATIGPASQDEKMIRELLRSGVNVARLNFSHGSHADHAEVLKRLRQIAAELGRPVCVLQDLQGPKIRTGDLPVGKIEIEAGQVLTLTTAPGPYAPGEVPVDFPELPSSVRPGGRILLDDGNLELAVLETNGLRVKVSVVVGGTLKSNKGINLPGAQINISALTEKDEVDLAFGLEQGVDAVALSFVRSQEDISYLRSRIAALAPHKTNIPIIAKLERPEALDNLEAIVHAAG